MHHGLFFDSISTPLEKVMALKWQMPGKNKNSIEAFICCRITLLILRHIDITSRQPTNMTSESVRHLYSVNKILASIYVSIVLLVANVGHDLPSLVFSLFF